MFGISGILKIIFDIIALFKRHANLSVDLLYQPVISTSSILLTLTGFQLLLIGLVSDALVRRFPRQLQERCHYREITDKKIRIDSQHETWN